MSDVRTPLVHVPVCARCTKLSLGGEILEMEPVSASGEPIMTVEFYCEDHIDRGRIAVMSSRLYPAYRILYVFTPSKMKLMRLDRAKQAERLLV